jgi:hypothetical protein
MDQREPERPRTVDEQPRGLQSNFKMNFSINNKSFWQIAARRQRFGYSTRCLTAQQRINPALR